MSALVGLMRLMTEKAAPPCPFCGSFSHSSTPYDSDIIIGGRPLRVDCRPWMPLPRFDPSFIAPPDWQTLPVICRDCGKPGHASADLKEYYVNWLGKNPTKLVTSNCIEKNAIIAIDPNKGYEIGRIANLEWPK